MNSARIERLSYTQIHSAGREPASVTGEKFAAAFSVSSREVIALPRA
jgi:hypothetical protein